MNLAEIAETVPTRKPGLPCPVALIREGFGDVDRATLDAYLAGPKTSQWISDLIDRSPSEIKVKAYAIARHRRGECRCSR
jgi:hypothetical protein